MSFSSATFFSIILPLLSLGLAIWFASSAHNNSKKAQATLDSVNSAIEGWHKQFVESTVGILDSTPQVIEGKIALAKVQSIESLTEGIKEAIHQIVNNPQGGASGSTQEQTLKTLTRLLDSLLNSNVGTIESDKS